MSKLIVFMSLTGNIRKFVSRLDMDNIELSQMDPEVSVDRDYILIAPTYSDTLTDLICKFIEFEDNEKHLLGIVGSGDKNFNSNYIFSAKDLSKKYKKPIIFNFEKSGNDEDIENFKKEVDKY